MIRVDNNGSSSALIQVRGVARGVCVHGLH
jgi:hypothetical protein